MGVLTDFLIASPQDVENTSVDWACYEQFPMIPSTKTDPITLATLEHILTGIDLNQAFESTNDKTHWIRGPEEPSENAEEEYEPDDIAVYWVNTNLVKALAAIESDQLQNYATLWAETEEWQLDNATPDGLVPLLKDLSELASRALNEGKNMYLRMLP